MRPIAWAWDLLVVPLSTGCRLTIQVPDGAPAHRDQLPGIRLREVARYPVVEPPGASDPDRSDRERTAAAMFAGMEPVTVALTLFTDALVIQGSVTTIHRRVTDILNQAEAPFLVLDQVTIQEHGLRGQAVSLPFAQVNLDAILFATADIPVEPNPSMRVVKTAERAVVSVPPFRVAGNVHLLVGDGDIRAGLRALTEAFVPITEATYWSEGLSDGRRQALLVAVNHRRVHYIAPHRELDPWAGLEPARVVEAASQVAAPETAGSAVEVEAAGDV